MQHCVAVHLKKGGMMQWYEQKMVGVGCTVVSKERLWNFSFGGEDLYTFHGFQRFCWFGKVSECERKVKFSLGQKNITSVAVWHAIVFNENSSVSQIKSLKSIYVLEWCMVCVCAVRETVFYVWFSSCLTCRLLQVHVDGAVSGETSLLCTVPQGSVLGPLLFFVHTAACWPHPNLIIIIFVVDDLELYFRLPTVQDFNAYY